MSKAAETKLSGASPAERDSVRCDAVDGRRERACEHERWRVDEWNDAREYWWVIAHHETYAKAADQLDYLAKNCAAPKRRWRVVWIRERVQLLSESPIAEALQQGGGQAP